MFTLSERKKMPTQMQKFILLQTNTYLYIYFNVLSFNFFTGDCGNPSISTANKVSLGIIFGPSVG